MAAPIDLNASKLRVSSVLNRDTRQFGKKHLVDDDDDTCWNSDQGSPQWIMVDVESGVIVDGLQIQFQGGFAGKDCWIEGKTADDTNWEKIEYFYPQDNNSLQTFQIDNQSKVLRSVKIVFSKSTDFFGRITIYRLALCGETR